VSELGYMMWRLRQNDLCGTDKSLLGCLLTSISTALLHVCSLAGTEGKIESDYRCC
jgi:hypothetical protein